MKNKRGISLIVLVITIIVMIILAAAVIITISNTGIINRANEATSATNLKQVQQLATLTWSDAYIDGLRGQELKDAVLGELGEYANDYTIDVTDKGVTVTMGGNKALNQYGFYYDELYVADNPYDMGSSGGSLGFIFRENKTADFYMIVDIGTELIPMFAETIEVTSYENLKANLPSDWFGTLEFSDGGKKLTGNYITGEVSFDIKENQVEYGKAYTGTSNGKNISYTILSATRARLDIDGETPIEYDITYKNKSTISAVNGEYDDVFINSFDNQIYIFYNGEIVKLSMSNTKNEIIQNAVYKRVDGSELIVNGDNIKITKDGATLFEDKIYTNPASFWAWSGNSDPNNATQFLTAAMGGRILVLQGDITATFVLK